MIFVGLLVPLGFVGYLLYCAMFAPLYDPLRVVQDRYVRGEIEIDELETSVAAALVPHSSY